MGKFLVKKAISQKNYYLELIRKQLSPLSQKGGQGGFNTLCLGKSP
jgi:hypothetical protein